MAHPLLSDYPQRRWVPGTLSFIEQKSNPDFDQLYREVMVDNGGMYEGVKSAGSLFREIPKEPEQQQVSQLAAFLADVLKTYSNNMGTVDVVPAARKLLKYINIEPPTFKDMLGPRVEAGELQNHMWGMLRDQASFALNLPDLSRRLLKQFDIRKKVK